ncbi:MAG: methyltransferase domain-containing protein [Flavobacteriales bacterium]|nr:methyltransferase domain-containing protein [Flavobacteriales bacterium]MCB9167747.1 methyltransferase domain-containing protein [Flavobacteriales bacterium]
MTWYRDWFGTPYYAMLYGHRDGSEARPWVGTIIDRTGIRPGSCVLDVACGRGRHALWFAQAGMQVEGIDISPENIAEAQALVPQGRFHVHDMREPFAIERCDLVVSLFTSLGYFTEPEDDQRAVNACVQALRPGGWFVVDFMNTPRMLEQLVPEEEVRRNGVVFHIRRVVRGRFVFKMIDVTDKGCTHHFEERVEAIVPEELERMVTRAGASIVDRTDGPRPTPFDPVLSDRFVLWARRPLQ